MLIPNIFAAAAVLSSFVAAIPVAPSQLSERSGTVDPVALARIKAKLNSHSWSDVKKPTSPKPTSPKKSPKKVSSNYRPSNGPATYPATIHERGETPMHDLSQLSKRSGNIDPVALARIKAKLNSHSWSTTSKASSPKKSSKKVPTNYRPSNGPATYPPTIHERTIQERTVVPKPIDLAAVAKLKAKLNSASWSTVPKSPLPLAGAARPLPPPRKGEPLLTYGLDYGQKTSAAYNRLYKAPVGQGRTVSMMGPTKRGLAGGKHTLPSVRINLDRVPKFSRGRQTHNLPEPETPSPKAVPARQPQLRISNEHDKAGRAYRKTPVPLGTDSKYYPKTSSPQVERPATEAPMKQQDGPAPAVEKRANFPKHYQAMLKKGPVFQGRPLRLTAAQSKIGPFHGIIYK